MIYGEVGAGKTSLAKKLAEQEKAFRFSHDEWMVQLYGRDPDVSLFPIYHDRVSLLMQKYWTRCLELNQNVVLDCGFWRREVRDDVRRVGKALSARVILIHVSLPEDERWRRVASRNLEPDALFISRDSFDRLKHRIEPLSDDEPRTIYTESNDPASFNDSFLPRIPKSVTGSK